MSFDPYIHIQGNCRAAMTAYEAIFGGRLEIATYDQAPDAPEEMKASDLVMHATLHLNGRILLASDFPPGVKGDPQQAVSISHIAASVAEAKRLFAALSEGGEVVMDYQSTFWSDGFGMLKDRFGTHWMVSAPWRQPG